jgi:hypothetical protein
MMDLFAGVVEECVVGVAISVAFTANRNIRIS